MTNHIQDFLSAYIDNELAENERRQVEEHLETCSQCHSIMNDMMELQSDVLAAFHAIQVPDALEDKVIHAIGNRISNEKAIKQSSKLLVPLAGLLGLFAFVLILTGPFLSKLVRVICMVLFNMLYALGSILGSEPYMIAGIIGFSVILIVVSSISLTHLLKTKTI